MPPLVGTPVPTATLTVPALTQAPTATFTPTVLPSATPTPAPTATPTIVPTPTATPQPPPIPNGEHTFPITGTDVFTGVVPTPLPLAAQPAGALNVLLLGVDGSGSLTDVMVVASIDPDTPSVSLLSIPRDYYAWVPGHGYHKINTTMHTGRNDPGGGIEVLKQTIEYNFGIPIHYYALVNFQGFASIVDALGGVDIPVECELHDTFPDPNNPEQGIEVDFYPGVQHLDGYHALAYVRSRWSTHDYDRNRRQQQMLRALFRRGMDANIVGQIPDLWGAAQETVQTDLGADNAVWLGWVASRLDMSNVKSRFVGPPYVVPGTAPNGAYILLPVEDSIPEVVAEALQPPAAGRAGQPAFRVEIIDGTGRAGMGQVAAERLRWEGFQVVSITVTDPIYPRTQIIDLTTTDKGSPLWLLQRLYRREASDVIRQPTEGSPAEFRIVLGTDYDSCIRTGQILYVPAPSATPTPTPAATAAP